MLIDINENIKTNKERLIKFFYSSVEDDIDSWKYENSYYGKMLTSKMYDDFYFKVDLNDHLLYIKDKGNNYEELAKYNRLKYFKLRKYVNYILKYNENIKTMNFFQKCISALESIFIKEIRREKLESIFKNTS